MAIEPKFDAGKVADLARRISEQEAVVKNLRNAKAEADREYNSADVALSNLRLEFTRAAASNIDKSALERARYTR
jgi:uncharacterized coiled-coil protein SlyX